MEAPFTRVTLTVERTVKLDSMADLITQLGVMGLAASAQEQLWVIALDSINQIRTVTIVSTGTYHDCFVSVPIILSPVLLSATDRFIIAHNHPNGRSAPTDDDIDLTARVDAAAKVMDLSFDDHVIVSSSGSWSSMRALGHL
jgi:DNA repair protein RadC